jgi:DnaJ-class molecular chaperone
MTTSPVGKWFWESMRGKSPNERQIRCPKCDGKGEYQNYTTYARTGASYTARCGKCKGTGWATEWYWDD